MRPKLLFFVTEDWYFCSHRLPIARAAKNAGCEIVVATCINNHGNLIKREGFRVIPLAMSRQSKNPFRELLAILEIVSIYLREKPDLVHHVALKPVLYGSFAAKISRVPIIVNALAGLGYVFSSEHKRAKTIKFLVRFAFKALLNRPNTRVLLQNQDDQSLLVQSKTILPELTVLIRGSGVNIRRFSPSPEPDQETIVVTLVSRMLRDKGVFEFVKAAKLLKQQGVPLLAVLVGIPDAANPTSVSELQLESWQQEGWVEWWGRQEDIPAVWARSHIAVLPSSYGEGVPMSLIEAAACGRPIVTTDMPGCREIVQHGKNGLLVPVKNSDALAGAIRQLVYDSSLRKQMGEKGRKLVEEEFSEALVVKKTLELYQLMLGDKWPATN